MKIQKLILLAAVAAVVAPACVSSGKYKKLEGETGALKTQLEQSTAKANDLEQQLLATQQSNLALAGEKEALEKNTAEVQSEYQNLVDQLQQEVQQGNLKVTQYKNMLAVDIAEQIFFDSGSAKLKASGKTVLKKVGTALAQYQDKLIRVVGHTDNVPIAKSMRDIFPTNWELSVMRATNVVRFLEDETKVDPKRLIASGRGSNDPISPNDTPEGRKKNRRIEILLVDSAILGAMQQKPN